MRLFYYAGRYARISPFPVLSYPDVRGAPVLEIPRLPTQPSVKPMLPRKRDAARAVADCQRGVAMVEFALILPLLVLVTFGGFEMTRYILLNQKLDKAASSVADLTAQEKTLAQSDVDVILDVTPQLLAPFEYTTNGRTIVTSVSHHTVGGTTVNWQRGTGALPATSQIGTPGGYATMPAGFIMQDGETVISTEIFYQFQAVVMPRMLPQRTLYKVAIVKPRLATLDTLSP